MKLPSYCWQKSFLLWYDVLHVLHTEIQSARALLVTVTPLSLSRNFAHSKQELRMSRNVSGRLLERKS